MLKNMKDYTYHIGLELRAYPSFQQIRVMKKNGGAANFIYNRLVAIDRERWRLRKTAPYSIADQARLIYLDSLRESCTSFEEAVPFLADKEIDADMVQQAFAGYRVAWKNYREHRAGIPTFHKRGNEWTYRTSNHYTKAVRDGSDICGLYKGTIRFLDESHIMLSKIGRIRVKGSKKLMKSLFARTSETRIGSVSITYDTTSEAYIHLALASDEPFYAPYPQTGRIVGADLNLTNFLYDSDGVEISSPKYLCKVEKKLKKAQRKLSRKYEAAKRDHRNCYESVM